MHGGIEYLPDDQVDETCDRAIRELLTCCFTKPEDTVFQERRYFRYPYPHRWVIRDERGAFVAHVGVHEKVAHSLVSKRSFPVAGIAEVCVHPNWRGRGLVKSLLEDIHVHMRRRGFHFAVLFGDPRVYGSSGYRMIHNLCREERRHDGNVMLPLGDAMMAPLANLPWPEDWVNIPGAPF